MRVFWRLYFWPLLSSILRLRHCIRFWVLSPFLIEHGMLRCTNSSASFLEFGTSDVLGLDIKEAFSEDASLSAQFEKTYALGTSGLCEIRNAHLVGPYAAPITAGHRLVTELLGGKREFCRRHDPVGCLRTSFTKPAKVIGSAFSIIGPYTQNYYHWITDSLALLRAYEYYRERRDAACELIIPAYLTPWQADSLQILGYDPQACQRWAWDWHHWAVERLVLPSSHRFPAAFESGPLRPSTIRWLRDRILSAISIPVEKRGLPKRIFVSRKDSAKHKRLTNEEELQIVLEKNGFTTVCLSDFDFASQVALFNQASAIVGIHGAGLTNILFCNGAKVVEILPRNMLRVDFFSLASSLPVNYKAVVAHTRMSKDCYVEPSRVLDLLGSLNEL